MRTAFLVALGIVAVAYLAAWIPMVNRFQAGKPAGSAPERRAPTLFEMGVGFLTNFLDTLGIGSFATTTSIFKLRRMVPDQVIPGTLNVGHALPTIVEACIYISAVQVDIRTLVTMIGASVIGAWFGAGVVAAWPRRTVQVSMGLALMAAATLMLLAQFSLFPAGGESLKLEGMRLWVGAIGNLMLGALMTIGIGLYAPCMVLVSLLGMEPRAAFPIMMGSCAFLMPAGSIRFIRSNRYSLMAAIGLTLGGIPAVLLAAYVVRSLPLGAVRWLVVAVVVYTASRMLQSAAAGSPRV